MRALALIAFLGALAWSTPAAGQISPGPLARAHQSLEGATKCNQCHGTSKDAMPRLCLNCHQEVTLLVSRGRGYHARDAKTSGKSCASCHPDHAGRDFAMIAWPAGGRDKFDHGSAGWPLEGKHAPLSCAKCHTKDYRNGPAALISPRRGTVGWMGLEQPCASCHAVDDPHQKSLGSECEACHTAADWAPAPKFRHSESRYPLTGAHEQVDCNKCHLAPTLRITPEASGKVVPRYRPVPFAECSSCHADPHKGRLSTSCSECHVTEGFTVLDRRGFNHALTRYPLLGKHRQVSCESCHGPAIAKPRPVSSSCTSCHADRHGGEGTLSGQVVDCASCHLVEGFAPSTFTVDQHGTTRFSLGGKHRAVACAACHTTTPAAGGRPATVRLRLAFGTCSACHAEPHADQLPGTRCESCHSDAGWKDSRYDRAQHGTTKLPLEGRHAMLACSDCHGATRPGLPAIAGGPPLGTAGVRFHLAETQCAACHANPHRDGKTPPDSLSRCGDCHSATAFRPTTIAVATHDRFRFPLEGAHRAIPCQECHKGLPRSSVLSVPGATLIGKAATLTPVPLGVPAGTQCASCHTSPHGQQFVTRPDSGRCDACHTSDAFVGRLTFDHERQSTFTLQGAHANVPCAKCHRTESSGGSTRVIYRPVTTRCEGCHAAKRPGGVQ